MFLRLALAVLVCASIWMPEIARAQSGQGPRVLFINPAPPEDRHWQIVSNMMTAAAQDLGVNLTIEHAFHSGRFTLKLVQVALQKPLKPHYIIFRNVDRVALEVFKQAQAAGVHTITIDAPLHTQELALIKGPRQVMSTWLGQIVPNTPVASEKMIVQLIETVRSRKVRGPQMVVAISGPESDVGSLMRISGIQVAVNKYGNANMLPAFPADWDFKKGDRQAYQGFRYGADAPIWFAADDNMALGILNMMRSTQRKLGHDTFVGAYHWTEPMMRGLLQNQVHYVAGGHFHQGALALLMAYDHSQGHDFADVGINVPIELNFLYAGNVKTVGRIVLSNLWERINFRQFSRAANPGLQTYVLDVNTYLRAAAGQ